MAFWFVREVMGSDLLLVTFCFFRKRVKEALINSALRLHASALSSCRPAILSVALATPAVCLRRVQCIHVNPEHLI